MILVNSLDKRHHVLKLSWIYHNSGIRIVSTVCFASRYFARPLSPPISLAPVLPPSSATNSDEEKYPERAVRISAQVGYLCCRRRVHWLINYIRRHPRYASQDQHGRRVNMVTTADRTDVDRAVASQKATRTNHRQLQGHKKATVVLIIPCIKDIKAVRITRTIIDGRKTTRITIVAAETLTMAKAMARTTAAAAAAIATGITETT